MHQGQHLVDFGVDLRFAHAVHLEPEGDVLPYGQVRKECVALEDGVDRSLVRREFVDPLSVEGDLARVGGLQARNAAQQRGLAAARGAEQDEELTRSDVEGDTVKSCHRGALWCGEGLPQVGDA